MTKFRVKVKEAMARDVLAWSRETLPLLNHLLQVLV